MPDLDRTDRKILSLLVADARRTLADIAGRVSLSAPAVNRRIARLEELGVIKGYTVRVAHAMLGAPLEAFTELRFAGSTRVEEMQSIAARLPEVQAPARRRRAAPERTRHRDEDVVRPREVGAQRRRAGRLTPACGRELSRHGPEWTTG